MADETMWEKWAGYGIGLGSLLAFLFRKTRRAAHADLHERVRVLEQGLEEAVTSFKQAQSKMVIMERRVNDIELHQEDDTRKMRDALNELRDTINQAALRAMRRLSGDEKATDMGQTG